MSPLGRYIIENRHGLMKCKHDIDVNGNASCFLCSKEEREPRWVPMSYSSKKVRIFEIEVGEDGRFKYFWEELGNE